MNSVKEQIVTPFKQIYGLDYLRAIACIMEEPSYMLFVAFLIGLRFQEKLLSNK